MRDRDIGNFTFWQDSSHNRELRQTAHATLTLLSESKESVQHVELAAVSGVAGMLLAGLHMGRLSCVPDSRKFRAMPGAVNHCPLHLDRCTA